MKDKNGMGDALAANTVMASPQNYFGKKIYVEGYVDELFTPNLFEIEKQTGLGRQLGASSRHDLLVFVPSDIGSANIEKDKKVRVVGTLQQGLTPDIADHGSLDMHDVEHRPVLIVESIELAD